MRSFTKYRPYCYQKVKIRLNGDMNEMQISVVFVILNIRKNHTINEQSFRTVQPTRCDVSKFLYSCTTLYMLQTGFPSIIRSSKLHIQRHNNTATCL